MSIPSDQTPPPESAADELAQLQGEVAALHSQLDTRARRHRRIQSARGLLAAVLVVLAALSLTASVIGLWAARTTLNTDRWVATVAPLQSDPEVQAAVSTYLTGEIYSQLKIEDRLKEVLPPRAAFAAGPLAGQVRTFLKTSVDKVIASDQFATLWPAMNRFAHTQVMAILNNDSDVVNRSGETVTLDLLPVVNEVLRALEQQVPTIFGKTIDLPAITNGEIPEGLRAKVETQLGVTLPADFAQIPLYNGDELAAAQDAVVQFKRYILALVLGSLVLLGLALAVSPRRRRTVLQLGVWLAIWVTVLRTVTRTVRADLLDRVPDGVYRSGAESAADVLLATLRQRGTQLFWLGLLIAAVAYLVGPGRGAVAVRRWTARGWRALSDATRRGRTVAVARGPGFAREHLDALRIGGVVVAAVFVLLSLSWTGLLVVVVVLAAYELVVTLAARSAPEPLPGAGPGSPSAAAETVPTH